MSTPFYDLASLVVVPSGYKASKVYAQKPLTTDGQLTFSRASTATRVNSAGLIEEVASNVPRLDYLGSTCPKLQLEPQRSNLALHNSAFDNAVWNKANASVSANQAASPDGATNADKLVENSSSSFHDTNQQSISYTAAAYTVSVFAKAAGRNHIFLQIFDGGTFYTSGTFNLSNGTVSGSGSIVSYGSGWYRCSFTATTASGSGGVYINLSNGTTGNYQGDGTSGVFVYGAQLELGAYSTSLIQTTTASVTRLADACSKTAISSLIGQTEGTIFVDVVDAKRGAGDLWIAESVVNNGSTGILIYADSSNSIAVFINGASNLFLNASVNIEQPMKIAVAYKSGAYALAINGMIVATSTNAMAPPSGMNQFAFVKWLGSSNGEKQSVRQALLFKTRLTNAQLAELTTL